MADPAAVPDPDGHHRPGLGRLVQELDAAVSAEARKTAEAAAADAPAEQGDKGDKGKAENGKPAAEASALRQTEAITYQFAAALMRSIKNAYNGRRTSPHGFGKLK